MAGLRLSLSHPSPLAEHRETCSTQLTTIRALQEKELIITTAECSSAKLLSYLLCSICGQLSDEHSGRLILWVANFMTILCSGSIITDFPDAWHAAACCSVDIEWDDALLNIPFWLVSLFLCRGLVMLRLCGIGGVGGGLLLRGW